MSMHFDGHEFAGWVPAKQLTDEEIEVIDVIESQSKGRVLGIQTREALDERRRRIEGDLVPTCECGWAGLPDDWRSVSSRESQTGQQHIAHRLAEEMKRIQGYYAARMASAALKQAADAWDGDQTVSLWLRNRAEHIVEAGHFEGEE